MGSPFVKQFGELVAEGKYNAHELKGKLISNGYDPVQVCDILQGFYDNGLLNDEPLMDKENI